ncbi:hypothetical protein [Streptomyces sp. NBC_00016]|uniref:effector-associated constant component EACC1 n=1 Tax=Streptomyces sp. NBC_00016 TaxID=2975622 RepID=UPI0038707189
MYLRAESSSGEESEPLASFYKWLLRDSDVSAATVSLVQGEAHPGAMSGGLETVLAVTEQVGTLASLVLAYLTWRSSGQGGDTSLRITIERDGETMQIQNLTDSQLRDVIERFGQR